MRKTPWFSVTIWIRSTVAIGVAIFLYLLFTTNPSNWNIGCNCFSSNRISGFDFGFKEQEPFSLPVPIPQWPQGGGFAKEKIRIGQLELAMITQFESVWSFYSAKEESKGATFYKPKKLPNGFHCLGHYSQSNNKPLQGFLLVAREISTSAVKYLPPLKKPLDYTLIWTSFGLNGDDNTEHYGYFWLPLSPKGYKSLGFIVTNGPSKPSLDSVRCVRSDLTDTCETHDLIIDMESIHPDFPCGFWKVRPCHRGMWGKGIAIGTFFIDLLRDEIEESSIPCLKNFDSSLQSMPNLEQINAVIKHYGPTVYFHPNEIYLPSSVTWFFNNGATLYKKGIKIGKEILFDGSNLPIGGYKDGMYWIDIPEDTKHSMVKHGNLGSAELYVHIKPALGGTFTDIAMWVFYPFNGPATIQIGRVNIPLSKIGRHVSDWEHFTLRVSNFNGELWSVYFSQHRKGKWVNACELEFLKDSNKPIVYSSKSGHAIFPHEGNYLQGSKKLGIGVRNDVAKSNFAVDSSMKYKIVAAEYLRNDVAEPKWLQYMREWGRTINSRSELERIIRFLPHNLRFAAGKILDCLPVELYREKGPTGPKYKNNWHGDERC